MFLDTVSMQHPPKKFILDIEFSSQDVYGPETATPGCEPKGQTITNTSKEESAQKTNKTADSSILAVELLTKALVPSANLKESEESDHVVEIEMKFPRIVEEKQLVLQPPQVISQRGCTTMAPSNLMEIERNMNIA
uniref:Uncharacterized protein n=1 Tax=Romanomermis culicivorax TaxID=13658 RepID=A0A915II46_ROMCU